MSRFTKNLSWGVLKRVRHNGCTATEDDLRCEVVDLERKGIVLSM